MGERKTTFPSLPLMSAILLMGFVYFTTIFVFLQDWLRLDSSLGRANAMLFSVLAFMCLSAFMASVLTDPGSVPSSFAPETENPQTNETLKWSMFYVRSHAKIFKSDNQRFCAMLAIRNLLPSTSAKQIYMIQVEQSTIEAEEFVDDESIEEEEYPCKPWKEELHFLPCNFHGELKIRWYPCS